LGFKVLFAPEVSLALTDGHAVGAAGPPLPLPSGAATLEAAKPFGAP